MALKSTESVSFEQREIYVRAGCLAGTSVWPVANTDGTTACFERSCLRTFIRCRRHEAVVGPSDLQGVEGVGEGRRWLLAWCW
jgi:hypothetical protein